MLGDDDRYPELAVEPLHRREDETGENAIGQYIKIDGTKFRVIGLLNEVSKSKFSDEDNIILIPYTVAQREFNSKYITTWYFTYLDKSYRGLILG